MLAEAVAARSPLTASAAAAGMTPRTGPYYLRGGWCLMLALVSGIGMGNQGLPWLLTRLS